MFAVISNSEEANSHPQRSEKLATADTHAEDGQTNGNGNVEQETERGESEGDADTERGSDDEEEGVEDELSEVKAGHGRDDDDGEEDEDEENVDEDGDDEEEEEPFLKYERMSGPVNDLLKKDSASALAVSNKCLVHMLLECEFMY